MAKNVLSFSNNPTSFVSASRYYSLLMLCIGFWLYALPLSAQNLVNNPSFESTSSCPVGISEFFKASQWSDVNGGADTCSSPDLYAACAPNIGGANSPNALVGFQQSRTGSHHAGIILVERATLFGCNPMFGQNYREYIEGSLSSTLVAGQKYCVKLYMSLANCKWGTDDFGVYFTNALATYNFCTNDAPLPVTPQLTWCGAAIMEMDEWVEVKWSYTATGNENFFIIGNFNNDNNTDLVDNLCNSIHPYAYYFIDDVSITPGCCPVDLAINNVVQPSCGNNNGGIALGVNNTPVCGESGGFTYLWSNGTTTKNNNNIGVGTYTVTVTGPGGCTATLSTTLTATACCTLAASVNASNATCGSNTGSLSASASGNSGAVTYLWQNGSSNANVNNVPPGTYTVTVSDASGCSTTASATVGSTPVPTPPVIAPQTACNVSSVTLNATNAYTTYAWTAANGGTIGSPANAQGILATSSGTYTVVISNSNGCTASTQTTVTINNVSATASANSPCLGGTLTLSATGPVGATYAWSGPVGNANQQNVSLPNATAAMSGIYVVTVTGAGSCTATASVTVSIGSSTTPTFSLPTAVCQGSSNPPPLLTTSNNGITGIWTPATINTNAATSYTFVPNANQCATNVTINIGITAPTTPTFSAVGLICQGEPNPPTLPTTSNNGITGTWSPAVINTNATGSYTFAPAAGQCANSLTVNIPISTPTTPTFNAIPSICQGESNPPALPTTSNNGIVGTWNPATINTNATTSYTFTPNGNQCANSITISIPISTPTVPTFNAIPNICQGSTNPPALPTTSNNGITGTWSPAVINTNATSSDNIIAATRVMENWR